jgi:3-deoxy-7-phosphoheptulonate synthase
VALAKKLNPENEFGRLTIISRMGADKINDYLPQLINRATSENLNLLWICDPMHGNTYKTETGYKTRHFNTILKEIQQFFAIHQELGTIPGGVHFELTGDNVTECLGGAQEISDNDLKERYETACDPRLNNEQSLELAFLITELLRKEKA